MRRRILSLALVFLAASISGLAQTDPVQVASPDGQLVMRLFIVSPKDSILIRLAYSVTFHGKPLLNTSLMGFALHDVDVLLGETVGLVTSKSESVDETYTLPPNKGRVVRNHYNSLVVQYIQNGSLGRRTTIEARAYNDGIAFRYYIPRTSTVEDLQIEEELTDFRFAQDGDAYGAELGGYESGKREYRRMKLSEIKRTSLIGLPFLVEQPGLGWAAITEAQLDAFPGMYVFHPEGSTMRTTLAPRWDDQALAMHGTTPAESPWRVLMVATEPRKLLDSDILTNLNPPSAIADTSWIKPPKELVAITDSKDLEARLGKLENSGVKGVKLDLMNRADQQTIDLYRRAAKAAAQHQLMIEFENGPPPDGIERTWPNVMQREDTTFTRLLGTF